MLANRMKKTIVAYYSNTGNNRFLANQIAEKLSCEIIEIKPRIKSHIMILMGLSMGNKRIRADLAKYDRVILCGPIMMGKLLAPLKSFLLKNKQKIRELVFVTCCGSSYDMKDEKFGHGLVFNKVKEVMGDKCLTCAAFPILLVIPPDKREDTKLVMSTRLSQDTFQGEIKERFERFIESLHTDTVSLSGS